MQYNKEKLEKLSAIAEKHGTFESVANHLGISPNKLLEKREKDIELDKILKEAVQKYKANNCISNNYVFSNQELEDITRLVKEQNIESAARKYGVSAQIFHNARTKNTDLNEAIIKGQEERKSNSSLNQARAMFEKLDYLEALEKIKEITLDGGVEAVEKYYKVSPHILRRCRQELPNLDAAIKKGLKIRPTGAAIPSIKAKIVKSKNEKKERKISKVYNVKNKKRKPPKEIINKTMIGIEDQTETALLKFRKLMQENKKKEFAKRMRAGDFDDMIGV